MLENIKEVVSGLFQSPEIIALLSAAGAWLSANLVTIIVFACKYLKLKAKELKEKALHEEVVESITAGYKAQIEKLAKDINAKLNDVEAKVIKQVDINNKEEAEAIEKETLELKQVVKQTKKALSIDEILEEKK